MFDENCLILHEELVLVKLAQETLVRVFSDVLVAFLYFDICHLLVANIKICKSHLNIREGSD